MNSQADGPCDCMKRNEHVLFERRGHTPAQRAQTRPLLHAEDGKPPSCEAPCCSTHCYIYDEMGVVTSECPDTGGLVEVPNRINPSSSKASTPLVRARGGGGRSRRGDWGPREQPNFSSLLLMTYLKWQSAVQSVRGDNKTGAAQMNWEECIYPSALCSC